MNDVSLGYDQRAVWEGIRAEASFEAVNEPALQTLLTTLASQELGDALGWLIGHALCSGTVTAKAMEMLVARALKTKPGILDVVISDLNAVKERDPACRSQLHALLYLKGFQALQVHRIAHFYWNQGRHHPALFLQSRASAVFGVDIHPAAKIGKGILFDHATGIVIGETAVVGDNVSIFQGVSLGGTGRHGGDRHPKIGSGVFIGAGAKVLGNIKVGECARIAAGSIVLNDVLPYHTVAGIPARTVRAFDATTSASNIDCPV